MSISISNNVSDWSPAYSMIHQMEENHLEWDHVSKVISSEDRVIEAVGEGKYKISATVSVPDPVIPVEKELTLLVNPVAPQPEIIKVYEQ